MNVEAGASRYALTVFIYVTAVTVYSVSSVLASFEPLMLMCLQTRIPEAWKPGWFDIWGQSHQIFHVLMAVGLTVHFSAFAKAFDYTHTMKQC